jgi:Ca2+-transporting ATPase
LPPDTVLVPVDTPGAPIHLADPPGTSAIQDAATALPPCLQRFGADYTGIAIRDGVVIGIDGATFRECSDEELLSDVLPHLAVLARAVPLDKKRLVDLLHTDRDAVVATTGDGTNDAPALKAADVGFAMNTGSDIAKQASDIVLLDDNFHGVVKAVVWGRNVRNNIRKFLQFQMTVNFVACVLAFVGAVVNEQNISPLKPVQLLWLNLIMDTFAALALATELPDEAALLSRGPEPRTAPIITAGMRVNIAVQGLWQLALQTALLLWADDIMPELAAASAEHAAVLRAAVLSHSPVALLHRAAEGSALTTAAVSATPGGVPAAVGPAVTFTPLHITMFFNTFVLLQLFNFFNARKLTTMAAAGGHTSSAVPHGKKQHMSYFTSSARVAATGHAGARKKKRLGERLRSLMERSRVMVYIVVLIAALQVIIVQRGGRFMSTVPLSLSQWAVCVALGSTSLAVGAWGRQRWIHQSRFATVVLQFFSGALACLGKAEALAGRIMSAALNPIYSRLPGAATGKGKEQ